MNTTTDTSAAASGIEHPVRRKLRDGVLPFFLSAELLGNQWFCRWAFCFELTKSIIGALAGVGTGATVIKSEIGWWTTVGFVLAAVWAVAEAIVRTLKLLERAETANRLWKSFRVLQPRLSTILAGPEPLSGLEKLESTLLELYDLGIKSDCWPRDVGDYHRDAALRSELDRYLEQTCVRFEAQWNPIRSTAKARKPDATGKTSLP